MAGNDLWVLYRIAEQYYKKGKTQEEISREENISRSQVSRMLDRAKTQGIVRLSLSAVARLWLEIQAAERICAL